MGLGGISIWQLLIVLVIVLLLFGTKKLRNLGTDLGGAVKGFRSSMKDAGNADESTDATDATDATIEKAESDGGQESLAVSAEDADSDKDNAKV